MRRILAGGLVLAAAVLASPVPRALSGAAPACLRTVAIQPEVSVGEGTGSLTFTVTSTGCTAAGSVAYTVVAGTAQPPADFVLPSGQLQWAAGDPAPRTITATIASDQVPEADIEDFTVRLTGPSPGVRLAGDTGHGRILDDDRAGLIWVVDDCRCRQVITGSGVSYRFQDVHQDELNCPPPAGGLNRPPASPTTVQSPVTVHWETLDGTAKAGKDFVGVSNQVVTVPAGATRFELPVQIFTRPVGAPSRWFKVRISVPSAGQVVDAEAVVWIDGP